MEHKCGSATKKQMSTATVKDFVSTKTTFSYTAAQNNFIGICSSVKSPDEDEGQKANIH